MRASSSNGIDAVYCRVCVCEKETNMLCMHMQQVGVWVRWMDEKEKAIQFKLHCVWHSLYALHSFRFYFVSYFISVFHCFSVLLVWIAFCTHTYIHKPNISVDDYLCFTRNPHKIDLYTHAQTHIHKMIWTTTKLTHENGEEKIIKLKWCIVSG